MAIKQAVVTSPDPAGEPLPPLAAGMRLTRAEFHRRYLLHPEIRGAELIDGVVYMPSPIRLRKHAVPQAYVIQWLGRYAHTTPGVVAVGNASVFLDLTSEVEPDALLFIECDRGGQLVHTPDDYLDGAPELAVEVAASSAGRDLGAKLAAYERAGVQEYLVVLTEERRLVWFVAVNGRFEALPMAADGLLRSVVFPGLWLDGAALLKGDIGSVLSTLDRGLDTPEHAAFVAALART